MNKQQKLNRRRAGLPGAKIPQSNKRKGSKPGYGEYNANRIANLPKEIQRMFQ